MYFTTGVLFLNAFNKPFYYYYYYPAAFIIASRTVYARIKCEQTTAFEPLKL